MMAVTQKRPSARFPSRQRNVPGPPAPPQAPPTGLRPRPRAFGPAHGPPAPPTACASLAPLRCPRGVPTQPSGRPAAQRWAGPGAEGTRPRNRPCWQPPPLPTGASALLIQPVPRLMALAAQKTQSRTLTPSRAPHDPAIIIFSFSPRLG